MKVPDPLVVRRAEIAVMRKAIKELEEDVQNEDLERTNGQLNVRRMALYDSLKAEEEELKGRLRRCTSRIICLGVEANPIKG